MVILERRTSLYKAATTVSSSFRSVWTRLGRSTSDQIPTSKNVASRFLLPSSSLLVFPLDFFSRPKDVKQHFRSASTVKAIRLFLPSFSY